jgi:glycosyltransferase involved in cell wall biosynthesis
MPQRRPIVLFATPVLHHPPVGGPTLRIENSIKALSQCAELHVCSRIPVDRIGGSRARQFYEELPSAFHVVRFRQPTGFLRAIKRLGNAVCWRTVGRLPFDVGTATEDMGSLVELAALVEADVIWLGYGNISYPLLKFLKNNSRLPVVVDTDSVWSRFVMRELPYATTPVAAERVRHRASEKAEEERWGTALAEVTTAVSDIDAEYYRALARTPTQVQLFPNVIDVHTYRVVPPPAPGLRTPCVLLAGSFWIDSPMHDAARWTIDLVLPALKRAIPGIHLYIIGGGSDVVLSDVRDDAITISGRVESVLPYLCHSAAALVPLRFESGTRFKILEAGACGIPVVSTTLGAEGLPVRHGHNILIADDPDKFIASVIELVTDRERGRVLGQNLKTLVQANYGIDNLVTAARNILAHVVPREFDATGS